VGCFGCGVVEMEMGGGIINVAKENENLTD